MSAHYYFAYGSNMDATQMRQRCPHADFVSVGTISDWRFRINSRGVATIVPEDESAVHGIVWRISKADEQTLDRYEGVGIGIGLYTKTTVEVRLRDGARFQAFLYLAQDHHPGPARPGYMDGIVAAALSNGFPSEYVEELRTWSPIGG